LRSLVESTSRVEILKGKWSVMAIKLGALEARLSDLSVPPEDPLSSELMSSISATCSAASSLAAVCRSAAPPGGKLKTQNDLDSLSAKLDAHVNDLDVLIKTGLLSEDASASPATATASGKTEAVRDEARNLMTRLQIGSTESRSSALDSLLGLLQENDKNIMIAVAQGIVPILVRLLDSSFSYEIKEKTVTAIAKISTLDSNKHALLEEGLILLNDLMRVLESGSIFAKEKSCSALIVLSTSRENARAIGSRGGISSLLEICQEGTPNSQALAAGVLRNLAVFEEIKDNFLEENAVSTLIGLCNSGNSLAQENSIGCLANLISGDDDLKLLVINEGGIECVKNFWDSSVNPQSLEVAVHMVATLALLSPAIAESLVANGFLTRLLTLLNSSFLEVRIGAAETLCELSNTPRQRRELGEMGCIPLLLNMLDGKSVEEKNSSTKLLSILMNCSGNRRIFRKQEKGIVSVVKLLDPSLPNLDCRHSVRILSSLHHRKTCRKQMISAGLCTHLQRLADSDVNVDGAKKLNDSLRHNRAWRVIFG
ncbi:hypothetical protein M569_11986, partial [Genlisea aurea]